MDSNKSREMLQKLLEAVSTDEVQDIIRSYKFTDGDWQHYGNREKNWDIVSNQQSKAVGALTEIITNSIDAVLSRKAYESGIEDLTGDQAPQSMQDAVARFYDVIEGNLSSLEPRQLTSLAEESILIGVKRKRKGGQYLTITVVDFGEGQNPDDFVNTFLSLSETNKEGIAFVQGKFNMGSTGSIRFCTEADIKKGHYKLIVSKRYDGKLWGWTLIRVSEVKDGKKLPIVEYLAPNKKILSFKSESIQAFGDKEVGVIKEGSLVRLYDYDIGDGAHTVDFGLYQALTVNLLECALPVRLYDFGATETTEQGKLRERGIADRTFSGMNVMLKPSLVDQSNQNPGIPEQKPDQRTTEFVHQIADISDEELGKITIIGTGVSELPKFMKATKKRIFFTINGQTHAAENASFLNRKNVGLGDLQHNLIVNVQCEKMDKTAATIFMGNREQKVDNRLSRKLTAILEKHLKEDPRLGEYVQIIRRRRAAQILEDDQETKQLLSDLLTQDPQIRELLGLGVAAVDLIKVPGGKKEWKDGKQFPTFLNPLNIKKTEEDGYHKELPINSYRQIKCGTDANNDYFSRTNSPGWVYFNPKQLHGISISAKLHNGTATFTFTPTSNAQIGDKISLEVGFDDHGPRTTPLAFPLTLSVTDKEATSQGQGGKKTDTKDKRKPAVADPTHWVEQEDWSQYSFDEKSGATVRTDNENDSVGVWVNRAHQQLVEMKFKEADEAVANLNEARFRICLGFLTLAVYRNADNERQHDPEQPEPTEVAERVSNAMAPYILPLIKTLGGAEQV